MQVIPLRPGTRWSPWFVVPVVLTATLLLGVPLGIVSAQIDPQVRDRVVPAVVEIAIMLDVTENGSTESIYQPVGTGTIISPDGLILTNHMSSTWPRIETNSMPRKRRPPAMGNHSRSSSMTSAS